MSVKNFLKKSEFIIRSYDIAKVLYYKYMVNEEKYIRSKFKERLGRDLNLENPIYFNDKLQWLKLYWRDPMATICADKYKVREYVKERIGSNYLNELYGVYNSVDEIKIAQLPRSFVLKGTHGSGFNIICQDKDKINWDNTLKLMKRWMRSNYYWHSREWVYKDIKPRIICEKYLEEKDSKQLKDYKFFCFNGNPKIIQVDLNRFIDHRRNIYDLDWNLLDLEIKYPNKFDENIPKPRMLDEMIELSKKLSKGFPHVRVDFYLVEDRVYFGELTFFHGSGYEIFNPLIYEKKMGEWLELPI